LRAKRDADGGEVRSALGEIVVAGPTVIGVRTTHRGDPERHGRATTCRREVVAVPKRSGSTSVARERHVMNLKRRRRSHPARE
jgi:hypothetical protein